MMWVKRMEMARIGKAALLAAVFFILVSGNEALAQRLTTSEVTGGACMVICDDVSFCQAMDYNRQTGVCTIFMNPADRGFLRMRETCPQMPPEKWVVSFANGKWKISCPPRGEDKTTPGGRPPSPDKPEELKEPSPDLFEGLDDPQ